MESPLESGCKSASLDTFVWCEVLMKKTFHLVGRYGWPRGALEFWNQLEGSFLRWNKIEALLCDRPPRSGGWRERGAQQPPLLGPLTNATLLRKRRNIKNWREEIDKYKTKKKLYAQIPLHSALGTFSLSSSKCTSRKKAYWKNIFPAYDHCLTFPSQALDVNLKVRHFIELCPIHFHDSCRCSCVHCSSVETPG